MIIEVKNYSKLIKNKIILDDINVLFESGHIYGLYGRNGSGKTMLLRAICTLIYPTMGDVLIDQKSIINEDYDLRNFGVLIEEPGFYNSRSGLSNLSLLYEINNDKDDEYLISVMDEMGLKENKYKKYKEYSLGMKQKLRIIQTYMDHQNILLLDEPTNGLDEASINSVREKILKLKDEGKLIILASHNKEDLRLLCDTIYHLDNGRILGEIEV